jgi:hypothetical protein
MVAGEVQLLTHARCNISIKQTPRRHTVSNHELIAFVEQQAEVFAQEMADTAEKDMELDYAYAHGAHEAYNFMLKKLLTQLVSTKYTLHKEKFWVADDGSYGEGDILVTDRKGWSNSQNNALEHITDSGEPTIEDVMDIIDITREVN